MSINDNMTAFYAAGYLRDKKAFRCYSTMSVTKLTIIPTYFKMLRDYGLVPIEQLPVEQKKELVDEVNESGKFFTNETLTDAARMLHTLKFINANT